MALASGTIWEVETTGDDTNNGGAFDPSQTAGMLTDGAATSATGSSPVFSSASYNFVAGDVGAWVYIASGANWTPGWYKIASVSSNNATLSAAIGAAVLKTTAFSIPQAGGPNTAAGCATTASPTNATWTIDYSQQAAARYTYTDLASAGAGLTVSSAAKPFAKEQVGNAIVITGGTNFNTGRYVIASVAAGVATVVGAGNITSGVGASGTGSQGGALASIGQVGAHLVASNQIFIKTGTYTIASASTNIATGCLSTAAQSIQVEGYSAVRGDLRAIGASGTRPTLLAGNITTFTILSITGLITSAWNLILDGNSKTSSRGMNISGGNVTNCHGQNCTNSAFNLATSAFRLSATGCSTQVAIINSGATTGSVAYSNTITGFAGGGNYFGCLSYSNSGASSDGFQSATTASGTYNCTSYGNGRDGFRYTGTGQYNVNSVAAGNGGVGFSFGSAGSGVLVACAGYNNTGGDVSAATAYWHSYVSGFLTLTADPFTNAAGADFSLNNTSGGGASLRAAGYPGVLPIGGTGYVDVGALQHLESGGSAVCIFGG